MDPHRARRRRDVPSERRPARDVLRDRLMALAKARGADEAQVDELVRDFDESWLEQAPDDEIVRRMLAAGDATLSRALDAAFGDDPDASEFDWGVDDLNPEAMAMGADPIEQPGSGEPATVGDASPDGPTEPQETPEPPNAADGAEPPDGAAGGDTGGDAGEQPDGYGTEAVPIAENVPTVLDWVGDSKPRANAAVSAEHEAARVDGREVRKTLIGPLEELLGG